MKNPFHSSERLLRNKDVDLDVVTACCTIADRLLTASRTGASSRPRSAVAAPPIGESAETSQRIRVFISYSWDSNNHKDWVREFADQLATRGLEKIDFSSWNRRYAILTLYYVYALQITSPRPTADPSEWEWKPV